jgi:hypothetical protein
MPIWGLPPHPRAVRLGFRRPLRYGFAVAHRGRNFGPYCARFAGLPSASLALARLRRAPPLRGAQFVSLRSLSTYLPTYLVFIAVRLTKLQRHNLLNPPKSL